MVAEAGIRQRAQLARVAADPRCAGAHPQAVEADFLPDGLLAAHPSARRQRITPEPDR